MNWICIGMIAGSLVTSTHESREACEGRAAMLREAKVDRVKCVDMGPYITYLQGGTGTLWHNGDCVMTYKDGSLAGKC